MKKTLAILPLLAFLVGCAPEAKPALPPAPTGSFTVVLDSTSSTLTTSDSTAPITVNLKAQENEAVTYSVEIGAPCYLKTVGSFTEIVMKPTAYFKSVSTYKVDRVICDVYDGQGENYEVHNNLDGSGTKLERHESTIQPVYPEDSGAVYEYELSSSTSWSIYNKTEFRKPAFYSVKIVFIVE